jgi:5-methylcytosine-specific restriction endonuclease McrA
VREQTHISRPGKIHPNGIFQSALQGLKVLLAMTAMISVIPVSAGATDSHENWETERNHVEIPASPFWIIENQFGQRWASPELNSFSRITQGLLDLLDYLRESIDRPEHAVDQNVDRYNRLKHFGAWVRPDLNDCRNTRAVVLVRDANRRTDIEYRNGRECVVHKAKWSDPFTGTSFKLASAMDIDHIVPLKHAYVAGAHTWTPPKRCHYANYLEAEYHLLAVSGSENKRKAERSPERYMPPNERFHCRYLGIWVKIKTVWELSASKEEYEAIETMIREKNCKLSEFKMPAAELKKQRLSANQPIASCATFGRRPPGQGDLNQDEE